MPTPFLILTLPRSGSYHLAALLDSAPDLTCHGEIYKAERVELPPVLRARLGGPGEDPAARDAAGPAFLAALEAAAAPGRAVGFKAFPAQLRGLPHRRALLFGRGRRRVILRRDPVETFLSLLRARAHGRWTRMTGEAPPPPATLRWRRAAFEAHLRLHRAFDDLAARMERERPHLCHAVDYAALDDPQTRARLLRFLGSAAAPETLRSDRRRQHEGPPLAGVENAREMRADLAALGLAVPGERARQSAERASASPGGVSCGAGAPRSRHIARTASAAASKAAGSVERATMVEPSPPR